MRREPTEDDAWVERLARKLDTVPPRRDASGIFPRREGGARPARAAGAEDADLGGLDEPFIRR